MSDPDHDGDSSLLLRRWGLPLLLLVTTLAYAALWSAGFAWDDEALVVDNQVVGQQLFGDGGAWVELWTRDLWSTTRLESLRSGYYRPLFLVSLALDRAVAGLNATWAHAHSLAWHLAAIGALYALLRRMVSVPQALAGATLFALHPVQSEAIALIAARNDSLAATFTLLALWLVADPSERRPRHLVGAFLLTLCGLLSKESGVLAPVMLLALDLGRGQGRTALTQGWLRYVAMAVAVLVYGGIRIAVDVNAGIVPGDSSYGLVAKALPAIGGVYARLLVWPWPLSPARYLHYLPGFGQNLPAILVLSGLLAWAVAKGRHRGLVLAGVAWALLAWAPTLAATLDKGLLGERYLYMPLAGLGIALAGALHRVPRWLPLAFALPAILVLQLRLPDWKDSQTVWTRAHQVEPTPFTAAGLAWYRHRDGDLDSAIPLLIEALEGEPPYRDACELVLMAMLQDKRDAQAVEVGTWALTERGCRADGLMTHHLALAQAGTGDWDGAVRTALERPGGPSGPSMVVVGAARARSGDLEGYAELARRQADPVGFTQQSARLLRLSGENDAAQAVLAMLRSAPPPPASPTTASEP